MNFTIPRVATLALIAGAFLCASGWGQQQPPMNITISPSKDKTGATDANAINFALQKQCPHTAPCNVQLNTGAYYLNAGIQIPSNTTLTSAALLTSAVTLFRVPTPNPQPIITMSGSNVTLEYVTIDGQYIDPNLIAASNPYGGTNVVVIYCQNCTVNSIDSSHARHSSIVAEGNGDSTNANASLTIENCIIHDNGQPLNSKLATKSDGLSLQTVNGHSLISNNIFNNNTDVDFIMGGGMSSGSTMTVTGNRVLRHTLHQGIQQALCPTGDTSCAKAYPQTGAGIMFDAEGGWCGNSTSYYSVSNPPNPIPPPDSCGDFHGFAFHNNLVQCGPDCGYPMAVGTHMADSWGNSPTLKLPAQNLIIDSSNTTDRITIDWADASSQIYPTVAIDVQYARDGSVVTTAVPENYSCSYSMLTGYAAVTIPCRPCTGNSLTGAQSPKDGTMCDERLDARYKPLATVPSDFDGDGKTDIAVFGPSSLTWYVLLSSSGNETQLWQPYGATGYIPLIGDLDGDGKTDFVAFGPTTATASAPPCTAEPSKLEPSTLNWCLLPSSNPTPNGQEGWQFGLPGDIPVPGDYDGDGITDIAVFRPSDATWYAQLSSTGKLLTQQFGAPGNIPVPGDYDGDGITDFAVFNTSNQTWSVLLSSSGNQQQLQQQFGYSGNIPVPGDYDGDGITDFAVFDPAKEFWYVLLSSSGAQKTQLWQQFGGVGDIPVPGDYDGDGKTDMAVFNPSNDYWYSLLSGSGNLQTQLWQQFGGPGDIPLTTAPCQAVTAIYRNTSSYPVCSSYLP